jgi:flagellum-specific peptidoglycan hydrolase FlgJ
MTALVSLSAGGAITGFSFVPGTPAEHSSPASIPVRLLALQQRARPGAADDAALRSAIVNVARYYLRMAQDRTPAEMEAIIWQHDSLDGADHGPTCAAFASLTLELAAQTVGRPSWVTGGTSYPWPLHEWADVRVDENPSSPGILSVQQDASAHGRWHPLGDGYRPRPGDWVLFGGHVEVVTGYARGVLATIGGDSLPNFSVNAHEYPGSLAAQGVVGFVDNGEQAGHADPRPATPPGSGSAGSPESGSSGRSDQAPAERADQSSSPQPAVASDDRQAAIPGVAESASPQPVADVSQPQTPAAAAIPGLSTGTQLSASAVMGPPPHRHGGHRRFAATMLPGRSAQQAFISRVAPGAMASQRRFGVPAAVTIAQAIDESGWGQSSLAVNDHNLFGIKGAGPAGTDWLTTQEYRNGQFVTLRAEFRVYRDIGESIDDHGELLATSQYYRDAMAVRHDPDRFAAALTGVYATDPHYGADLIRLMRRYNLYRYDDSSRAGSSGTVDGAAPGSTAPGSAAPGSAAPGSAAPGSAAPGSAAVPGLPTAEPGQPVGTSAPAPGPEPIALAPARPGHAEPLAGPTTPSAQPGTGMPESPPRSTAGGPSQAPAPTIQSGTTSPQIPPPAPGISPSQAPAPTSQTPPARQQTPPQAPTGRGGRAPAPGIQSGGTGEATPPSARSGVAEQGPPAPAEPGRSPDELRPPAQPADAGQALSPSAEPGGATPGLAPLAPTARAQHPGHSAESGARRQPASPPVRAGAAGRGPAPAGPRASSFTAGQVRMPASRYREQLPVPVREAFTASAKLPLLRAESLYRDVASHAGIRWELLAACDWMQCRARPRYSPVHGEKLGRVNPDGSVYRTKSAALERCADDLTELARTVYQIDLTRPGFLSVSELANVFAAFRWGGLLRQHRTSAMEFPYSVAGLTVYHTNMRWPSINAADMPDKPGSRFRPPFGAVPVVVALNYPATADRTLPS